MAQFMIDMMVMMMPYMKPIASIGLAAVISSLMLILAQAVTGRGGALAAPALKIAIAVGLFFVACEIAGRLLGMEPTLLFSEDPFERTMYRNQWPFWAIGAAFLIAGLSMQRLGRSTRIA